MNYFICIIIYLLQNIALGEDNYDYPRYDYSPTRTFVEIKDPLEKFNRKVFYFNMKLDHFLLKPIARGYNKLFCDSTKYHVKNFLDNTQVPLTTANSLLQGNISNTLLSFWQFAINTTLGIGGIFNIAKHHGNIQVSSQTFGNTLARYGVKSGPYIVLPFFGSSTLRDMWDPIIADTKLNWINYHVTLQAQYGVAAGLVVSERAALLDFTDYVEKSALDPYAMIRSAWFQQRENLVKTP